MIGARRTRLLLCLLSAMLSHRSHDSVAGGRLRAAANNTITQYRLLRDKLVSAYRDRSPAAHNADYRREVAQDPDLASRVSRRMRAVTVSMLALSLGTGAAAGALSTLVSAKFEAANPIANGIVLGISAAGVTLLLRELAPSLLVRGSLDEPAESGAIARWVSRSGIALDALSILLAKAAADAVSRLRGHDSLSTIEWFNGAARPSSRHDVSD